MTIQYSTTLRNNRLQSDENTVSATGTTTPRLRMYTGAQPANCAAAATGTMLCEMVLPTNWLTAPASGAVDKSGTWSGTAAASGAFGYYRIWDNAVANCHEQGSLGATGSPDMTVDNANVTAGQTVTVTTYTKTASGA